jgi:very-short-patch-repair endonuclease
MVRRDQDHVAGGYRVIRFTHWQIANEPLEVTKLLRKVRVSRA